MEISGGCLCGGVRFRLTAAPTAASYCHCTRCQGRTGSGASAEAVIDGRAFELLEGEGVARMWRPDGGWENWFCSECGAHLFGRNPEDPAQMSVCMSAFDDDPGVRPSWRSHVASAASWEPIPDDGLERFARSPP